MMSVHHIQFIFQPSNMYVVEEHYYAINKIFLKGLGIWPHDKSRLVFLRRVLILTLIVTAITIQLSVFITRTYNIVLFVKIMSLLCPCILIAIKYCIFMFKLKTIKFLHHFIQEDWKMMRNKLENDILQKHAYDCRNYIILIFQCSSFLIVIAIIIQIFPIILDFVLPLDESRPLKLVIEAEYFISQDDYLYTILLHLLITFVLYMTIILATGTQLLLFAYHSFGMFKIASHRIEYFINDHIMYMSKSEKERAIYKGIIHVVIAHRRAIEFSNILTSSFNMPYCIIVIIGVFSLSINLFRFAQAVTTSWNIEDALLSFFLILGHLFYMFVANYIGQKATDYNNKIFRLIYNTSWYLMPITSQKLILFLMTTSSKDFYYSIGVIFVGKIENFAVLVNTALSYVAVMFSIQ